MSAARMNSQYLTRTIVRALSSRWTAAVVALVGLSVARLAPAAPATWQMVEHAAANATPGETPSAVAVDERGFSYIAGTTSAVERGRATQRIYVTKIDPTGQRREFTAHLSGNGSVQVKAIAVDGSGNVYVTGSTDAAGIISTTGTLQSRSAGGKDAFIAKLSGKGTNWVYVTYLGGRGDDSSEAITVDADGNAYLTGWTNSEDFPTTGALQNARSGESDAFVAKINALGSALSFSTYAGGGRTTSATGIAVDAARGVYIAGEINGRGTGSGLIQNNSDERHGFVLKFSADGHKREYGRLLRSADPGVATALSVSGSGEAFVAGWSGAADAREVFLAKLDAAGETAFDKTVGALSSDATPSIGLDAALNAYVSGVMQVQGGQRNSRIVKMSTYDGRELGSTPVTALNGSIPVAVNNSGMAVVAGVRDRNRAYAARVNTCAFKLANSLKQIGEAGDSGSIAIETSQDCGWKAESSAPWLEVSPSGTGFSSMRYRVAPNTGGSRGAVVKVAGQALLILQAGAGGVNPLAGGITGAIRSNSGFQTNAISACDDCSASNATSLGFTLNFYGVAYSSVWVNNNGNITFGTSFGDYTPEAIPSLPVPLIAAFWADVDTDGIGSGITRYGQDTVDGHRAFGVNWINVGYFASETNKLNSFQLVLIDRNDTNAPGATSDNFDIELNYSSIQWETGDASSGVNGLGGSSARAGFTQGTGAASTYFELAGSGVNGAFLDGGNFSLAGHSANSGVTGRYVYPVRVGGGNICAESVSPVTANIGGAGGQLSFNVSASSSGCTWAVSNLPSWITVNSPSGGNGTGSSSVSLQVQASTSSTTRSALVAIAGNTVSITQLGTVCQITSLNPSSAAIGSGQSTNSFAVAITPSDCQWSASPASGDTWLSTSSSAVGSGNVSYTATANNTNATRTGTINVVANGTQASFSVSQAFSVLTSCVFTLAPTTLAFTAAGGPGTINVSTQGGCGWLAVSNAPSWITVTSAVPVTGTGSVTINVAANGSSAPRTGTLTIASQTYTITQAGASSISCTTSLPNGAPQVAREGRTEIIGTVQLTCTGLTGNTPADLLLTLNTNVTNPVSGSSTTDAQLQIGANSPINGQLLSYTTLRWPGLTLTPSGGSVTFQIRNVRADASFIAAGSPITGQLSMNAAVPVIIPNSNPTLATAVSTLSVFSTPGSSTQSGVAVQQVSYQENLQTSFGVGTRFRLVLTNIPAGVQVYAPINASAGTASAQLYSADCSGNGGSPITTGTQLGAVAYSPLSVTGGVASATWLVTSVSGAADTLTFPMAVTGNTAAWSTIQASGSYAPVSPAGTACGGSDPSAAVVPRYRDFSVPLQFSQLRVTPGVTVSPTGAITITDTVTNTGNQPWTGLINSAILPGAGSTGTLQITCPANDSSCSVGIGQTTWSRTVPASQTIVVSANVQSTGSVPTSVRNVAGLTSPAGGSVPTPPTPPPTGSGVMSPAIQVYTPQSGTYSGSIPITGYAASGNPISGVQIFINGNPVSGTLTYGLADSQGQCGRNGWTSPDCATGLIDFAGSFSSAQLNQGNNVLTAVATDSSGATQSYPVVNQIILMPGPPGGNITVSGTVSGPDVNGVSVCIADTLNCTNTVNGAYSLSVSSAGSYVVTAYKLGYAFGTGTSFPILNPSSNQTVNFSESLNVTGLDFYPVTPCRVADTRVPGMPTGFGPPGLTGGETRPYHILSSPCAASVPANVAAYALNFTVVPPSTGQPANLTTWPAGLYPMPVVSTLNYSNSVVAGFAIVPAGANGAIDVFANFPTQVLFDIVGYFAPPSASGLTFFPVNPCRVADTRVPAMPPGFGPPNFSTGETRVYNPTQNVCAANAPAAAYSLNFTVVPPSNGPASNLTTWPDLTPMPTVSTLNYSNLVVANAAIVPAGTNRAIDVYANNATAMLFDINGYYAQQTTGLHFYPVTPCRVADTRIPEMAGGFGPPSFGAGETRTYNVRSSTCASNIPANVAAYSLNFTVVPPSNGPAANLTTWPAFQSMPVVSTLNFYGNVVANAAIVPAASNGAINVYVNLPAHVLFDINGYFAP